MTSPSVVGPTAPWWRRPEVRGVLLLWLLITIVLVFISFVPARIMGPPASPTKRAVETTMTVFMLAASPVAAVVWAVGLYSIFRWRSRGGGVPAEDGPSIRTNGPVTTIWVLASTVLCIFLLIWGLAEIPSLSKAGAAENPLVVDVTGQQWVWTFSYPQNGNFETDQLYLPLDRPVVFRVTSADVIHSFWVVQMGIKVDANPGEVTETNVTPTKLGRFDVRCAELCGLLHADMETSAHVVTAQDFQAWASRQGGPVKPATLEGVHGD